MALLGLVIGGCVWVILSPSSTSETNGAFGILGIVAAYLCSTK